jgi:uncharacterized protein YqiB (DUF1249 family)
VPKQRYKLDLAGQMAECEANYARLMKLLPDMGRVDHCRFAVQQAAGPSTHFCISVKERCKYTTMLEVSQSSQVAAWAGAPDFSLRVYHDAQMAEVTAFQGYQRLQPIYPYPNHQMLHVDEKSQLNTFLGEWLSYCLKYGHAVDMPSLC